MWGYMESKKELVKICIDKTAEIVRFLLEANKRPKIIEELPEEELKEYQKKFASLSLSFYKILLTPRQEYEIQQREKETAIQEVLKGGNKKWK